MPWGGDPGNAPGRCATLCLMQSSTVRELLLKTSEIVRQVAEGESFIIEKRGVPVAEIRPISDRPTPRMADREALIMSGPETRAGNAGRKRWIAA